jgi:hypothetical protein
MAATVMAEVMAQNQRVGAWNPKGRYQSVIDAWRGYVACLNRTAQVNWTVQTAPAEGGTRSAMVDHPGGLFVGGFGGTQDLALHSEQICADHYSDPD